MGKEKDKKDKGSDAVVYRIHDVPKDEKLLELNTFVERFGYSVSVGNRQKTAQSINKLLQDVKDKKEQSMIELLAVRSMPKAVYTTKNVGHYGLGFDYYTHFTSPIRRYPDVMVHRLLEAKLNHTHYLKSDELELLCKHSSEMEKLASDAGWPAIDKSLLGADNVIAILQINGKIKDRIEVSPNISKDELEKLAKENPEIKAALIGAEIKKIIAVAPKLVNFVI